MNKKENKSFLSFEDNNIAGLLLDESNHENYPLNYYNIINGRGINSISLQNSYFGFIYENSAKLNFGGDSFELKEGMYFSSVGNFTFEEGSKFKMILIEVLSKKGKYPETNFSSYFHIGKVEEEGRLGYIDGCTDSLLIPPVKMGDPCLNHLHFPPRINQTQHTHPSHRIGIISKGHGTCITPFGNLDLKKGMIFVIKEWDGKSYSQGLDGKSYANGQHSFETYNENMDVIAFHPDSDYGSTDIHHPMINRTIVGGVSASKITDIQTYGKSKK